MNRKLKHIKYFLIVFGFFLAFLFSMQVKADNEDDNKRKGKIRNRSKFTEKTEFRENLNSPGNFGGGTGNPKGLPPDPDDGGDGWPVPVGDGLGVLLFGGLLYYLIRKKKSR